MDHLEQKDNNCSKVNNIEKRRAFIKQATVGIVVTSIPAKSAWGACNASGISGGSKSTTTCEMPVLSNGRSPGSWCKFVENDVTQQVHKNKIKAMFSLYSHASDGVLKAKCKALKQYILDLPPVLLSKSFPQVSLNVAEALLDGGDIANLASCYLNARLGFYNIPPQFTDADELMEHIYGVIEYKKSLSRSRRASDYGDILGTSFNDGVSSRSIRG
ncbi:hypothetical protein [Flavobacterium sp. W21_SRS_FM6]|uniref:hypothetical protein n=1 Tax=Flavobacterium sp. W21_SRS_FM6 TaxID=3240268 RepID=UPI003F926BD5